VACKGGQTFLVAFELCSLYRQPHEVTNRSFKLLLLLRVVHRHERVDCLLPPLHGVMVAQAKRQHPISLTLLAEACAGVMTFLESTVLLQHGVRHSTKRCGRGESEGRPKFPRGLPAVQTPIR